MIERALIILSIACVIVVGLLTFNTSIASDIRFSVFYNGSLFAVWFYWLHRRVKEGSLNGSWLNVLDLIVNVTAISRFFGSTIPISGHALFLTYSLFTVKDRKYLFLALILLFVVIALKVSWNDNTTWLFGMFCGVAIGLLWKVIRGKRKGKFFL